MVKNYIYEIARIKMRELSLLSEYDKQCLINCRTVSECLDFLISTKGWGLNYDYNNYEMALKDELNKGWNFVLELVRNKSLFSAILCQNDYENLKISVKSVVSNLSKKPVYVQEGLISPEDIYEIVKKADFENLPCYMAKDAAKGMDVLLKTGDSQLLDIILDKSLANAMNFFAKESECQLIQYYVKVKIDCANIKTIVRGIDLGKDAKFLKNACLQHGDLDTDKLIAAAVKDKNKFYELLKFTNYSKGLKYLFQSLESFENWCDKKICDRSKIEKNNPFSFSPLVVYILAKINEIRVVRTIISSKLNDVPEYLLEERMRKMYA